MRCTTAPCLVLLCLGVCVTGFQDATSGLEALRGGIADGRRSLKAGTVTIGYESSNDFVVKKGEDASPGFKRALDKLAKAKGGILQIGKGTFSLSTNVIIISNDTTFKGRGMSDTVLKLQNKAEKFKYAGLLRGSWLKNIVVSDLTLDGNRQNQRTSPESELYGRYCFYMDGFKNLKITRARAQNCNGYGWDPHGIKPNPYIWSYDLQITNCEAKNNGFDGFTIDQIIGADVSDNLSEGNGRHGFNVVTGARDIVVARNKAVNNGFGPEGYKSGDGCGYVANDNFELGTKGVTFINNESLKSFKAGVCVLGAVNVQITNNKFDGAQYCGHFTQARMKKVKFSSNTCTNIARGGNFIGNGAKASECAGC